MVWYWVLGYFVLVAVVLLFVAGATRLAKCAEARDRMRPHKQRLPKKPTNGQRIA